MAEVLQLLWTMVILVWGTGWITDHIGVKKTALELTVLMLVLSALCGPPVKINLLYSTSWSSTYCH